MHRVDDPALPSTDANGEPRKPAAWWFGGGTDLTPSYLFEEDAVHFHSTLKRAAGSDRYARFKQWCDEYFYIKHRDERRGVGGIFFDDIGAPEEPEEVFRFAQSCGESFLTSYVPILRKRMSTPYEEHHKRWQALRRVRS